MMTYHDAFRQAILEQPDDYTHRLVYADWLQERGEEARAAFIRAQCSPDPPVLEVARDLDGRIMDITNPEQPSSPPEWLNPEVDLAGLPGGRGDIYRFERGFVAAVHLSAVSWFQNAWIILARHPIQMVSLTKQGRKVGFLREMHCWAWVRTLRFCSPLTSHQMRLATSPKSQFRLLRRLEVAGLPPGGLEQLRDALPTVEIVLMQ
jgi:uncharacterized protein (TIGR02996 family)